MVKNIMDAVCIVKKILNIHCKIEHPSDYISKFCKDRNGEIDLKYLNLANS